MKCSFSLCFVAVVFCSISTLPILAANSTPPEEANHSKKGTKKPLVRTTLAPSKPATLPPGAGPRTNAPGQNIPKVNDGVSGGSGNRVATTIPGLGATTKVTKPSSSKSPVVQAGQKKHNAGEGLPTATVDDLANHKEKQLNELADPKTGGLSAEQAIQLNGSQTATGKITEDGDAASAVQGAMETSTVQPGAGKNHASKQDQLSDATPAEADRNEEIRAQKAERQRKNDDHDRAVAGSHTYERGPVGEAAAKLNGWVTERVGGQAAIGKPGENGAPGNRGTPVPDAIASDGGSGGKSPAQIAKEKKRQVTLGNDEKRRLDPINVKVTTKDMAKQHTDGRIDPTDDETATTSKSSGGMKIIKATPNNPTGRSNPAAKGGTPVNPAPGTTPGDPPGNE